MATYKEKKEIAVGFVLPNAGFINDSVFDVLMKDQFAMKYEDGNQFFNKKLGEQIKEQVRFKTGLELWDEYEPDQKAAKKNLTELNKLLLAGDAVQLEKLFTKKPAAEWLNVVFLEETELEELIDTIKTSTSECRAIVIATIEKELRRLVNFKTLFENILAALPA